MNIIKESLKNEIKNFENGNINNIYKVYSCFATEDKYLIQEAADTLNKMFSEFSSDQIIKIYENFRNCDSIEWFIYWNKIDIFDIKKYIDKEDKWITILKSGTFHSNGYYREKCLNELKKYENTLPFIVLCMNDWVDSIREKAFKIAFEKIKYCNIEEIFSSMVYIYKVQYCGRRNFKKFSDFISEVELRLKTDLINIDIKKISLLDLKAKKFAYSLIFKKNILSIEKAMQILNCENDSFCREYIIKKILLNYDCSMKLVDELLNHKKYEVRYCAMQHKYNKIKNKWNGIEKFLIDKSRTIREFARFILRNHGGYDFVSFYISHLNDDNPITAICGIGETGNKNQKDNIIIFLESENSKTVKSVLLALEKIIESDGSDIYWKFLFDERISVSKISFYIISRLKIRYGCKNLYNSFLKTENKNLKKRILYLILNSYVWDRIPYMLLMADNEDAFINGENIIMKSFEYNGISMGYNKPSKSQLKFFYEVFDLKKDFLTERAKREIYFDLKYI